MSSRSRVSVPFKLVRITPASSRDKIGTLPASIPDPASPEPAPPEAWLERHEKWQLEKQPYFSTPKVSSFNAFSHYQDW